MRVSWISGCRLVALAATVMVLQGAGNAIAQFSPVPSQNQAYTPQQVYPQNQAYTQNLNQIYSQNPTYPKTSMQPQYTAMAFQPNGGQAIAPVAQAAAPALMQTGGYAAPAGPGCNTCQPAPVANYSPAPAANYESGCADNDSGYNTFSGGYGGTGSGLGLGARRGGGRQWFGGVYGLYMERTGNAWVPLAFSTDQPVPYYPTRPDYVLNLQDVADTQHSGVEFRLGSTFGGNNGCCGPRYAWEVGYWGLLEDDQMAQFVDVSDADAFRLYTNIDFRGLEYDADGAGGPLGYRPLNDYVDYAPPTADRSAGGTLDPIRVRSVTVRNRFSAQNIELNLLRLPLLGGGCGAGGCGVGGCNAGGCDTGCATGACGVGRGRGRGGFGRGGAAFGRGGSRYSLTTLVGVRYLRLDEDFSLGIDAQNQNTGAVIPVDLRSEADNHLVGFQLGCNGIYRLGCTGRWALNCSANAGIYGNRSEVSRNVTVPVGGTLRFVGGGQDFGTIDSQANSIATIAELRLGASYQYSCNWRFFGGYRALGVSGIALAFDQIPNDFSSPGQVQEYVNTNGSLFLHGLQGGVEFTY